jgi:hypothetical protein
MIKRTLVAASMVLLAYASPVLGAERDYLPLTWDDMLSLSQDLSLPHEGRADGVPLDYDWAQEPRLGLANNPGDFMAITGWGHAFPSEGSTGSSFSISIRDMRVLVCHEPQRDWLLLQQGVVEGSQFRPDYVENLNKPTVFTRYSKGVTSAGFEKGFAYHFWPRQGRADLPDTGICGVVVLLQAMTAVPPGQSTPGPGERSGILLSLGADYWKDKGAAWDNYQSNRDVAIGRLRWVGPSWNWFGISTASVEDLRRLYRFGYEIDVPQAQ